MIGWMALVDSDIDVYLLNNTHKEYIYTDVKRGHNYGQLDLARMNASYSA
eukprot:COSAG02_NODE_971_length_15551_cov_4.415157_2_plen_50_part_00